MTEADELLQVKDLKKHFKVRQGTLHAVDGVSFSIERGKTLGVVGESGCGKSTLGRVILGLIPATFGQVLFSGHDVCALRKKELKELRKEMQIIFQDPYASLNPRMTISEIIGEPLLRNEVMKRGSELEREVLRLMDTVGLAHRLVNTYPHELDGGRRQRVGIARALSLSPQFIVCDEPVSALDVSIQAQILNLMQDLQEEFRLTYLFITHDLSVVRHISDDIAVMYLGQIVESAPTEMLFEKPVHPYTKGLLSAVPTFANRKKDREILKGEIASPVNIKPGCRFAARCPACCEQCAQEDVKLTEWREGHLAACHLL